MSIVLILILAIIGVFLEITAKAYLAVPNYELKRRSRAGDKFSKTLYLVASYQNVYKLFNNSLLIIVSTFFYILAVAKSSGSVAFLLVFLYTFFIFFWSPRRPVSKLANFLARVSAKPLKFVLGYFNPIALKLFKSLNTYKRYKHTGMFEAADVFHLIEQQKSQADNRIDEYQLEIIKDVLEFNNQRVLEVMTPKRKVKAIAASDSLGPVVLDELHATGHHYFPVYEDKPNNIIGTLNLDYVSNSKTSPKVSSVMDQKLVYANEEQSVSEILQAMIKSNRPIFIVINEKGDYSGIITIRDTLRELVGEDVIDDIASYENKDAVSSKFKDVVEPEPEPKPEPEVEIKDKK
jgi:CBS domain containing-hemolysin-like protein